MDGPWIPALGAVRSAVLRRLLPVLLALVAAGLEAQPNVLVVVTDDQRADDLAHMATVRARLVAEGTSFSRFYATTPMCGPSRATLLRGQYAHNHGLVSHQSWPGGAYTQWVETGLGASTLGAWMRAAGYRTAYVGKHQTLYPLEADRGYVDPGWDTWFVGYTRFTRGIYTGVHFNHDGGEVDSGDAYRTDVEGAVLLGVVARALDEGRPFFAVFAPTAPHAAESLEAPGGEALVGPPVPAARHAGLAAGLEAPRPPSYDQADVSDKPPLVRNRPRIDALEAARIDGVFRARVESLLAVDEWVGAVLDTLEARGALDETYVVFTSDNGFMLGEHRLRPEQKAQSPYEETVRMPLVVRGPGVARGASRRALAGMIDLAPTILDWAGAPKPEVLDGRSLVPVLADPAAPWRTALLTESWHARDGSLLFQSVVGETKKLTRWTGIGFVEVADLSVDPYELVNRADRVEADPLLQALDALAACAGATCREADRVEALAPFPPGAPAVRIARVWPSPSRGAVTVELRAGEGLDVRLDVSDPLGRRVLDAGPVRVEGRTDVPLGLEALGAGVYVVRARWGGGEASRLLVIVR